MITRFAPSPTGPLHLGHAFSALTAWDLAQAAGGTFLLRIEDIDRSRARPEWEAQILDDLAWLGLRWPTPVMRQSDRQPAYDAALDALWDRGLLYPCTCNRRDILEAASAPQEGAPMGPDGVVYPGICRTKPRTGPRPGDTALRLDLAACQPFVKTPLSADKVGDVVLARRDMGTSYHLSVVIDDAAQGVTDVVRGKDLAEATPIHLFLQELLDLPSPAYHHHRLIRDDSGKRLAKRDDARALSLYRAQGATPRDIRAMVGL
ncbi:tRNA glutamyl-Q(34) synthetase GluQRS [Salipiger sp. IMCC34102]|uniref:tRNA glutamyl-Q(34) synthetase GluQRS n=1 Tax=Salipiger sp. IMCC34102 TaxID=2510647 RepID=UPI00101DBAF2|nr:tRNA glutamyl-Q(34) synthetase GluQRS [Salipiger sp. IMCC34102]RYH02770.1 tRNA glutamyl-Q(34) synthetase GluQRS [Salipiger sp. IMCC34102]